MDLTPAITAERWHALARSADPFVREGGLRGLLRLAVVQNDWSVAAPLVSMPDVPLLDVLRIADLLDARDAALPLLERLRPTNGLVLAPWIRTFERLGVADARQRLRETERERQALETLEFAEADLAAASVANDPAVLVRSLEPHPRMVQLFDRTGGDLTQLRRLAASLGPAYLPNPLVDALRRRDADATVKLLRELVGTVSEVRPDLARECALRTVVATAALDQLAARQPRKEKFDRAAAVALRHALLSIALVRADAVAALAYRILADRPVTEIARTADDDGIEALLRLDPTSPVVAAALVEAACVWGVTDASSLVVVACGERTASWLLELSPPAVRIEEGILRALPATHALSEGQATLVTSLASNAAAERAEQIVSSERILLRALQNLVAVSFPTPAVLTASRRSPDLMRSEVVDRLRILDAIEEPAHRIDPEQPFAHCGCGHAFNVPRESLAGFGAVWPDPPMPCPSCGRFGDLVAWLPGDPPITWQAPAYRPGSTPRRELGLLDDAANPAARADLLDLAGDKDAADAALAALTDDDRALYPDAVARLLLRRGRAREAYELTGRALADLDELLFLEDGAEDDLKIARALAAKRLGIELAPEPPRSAPDERRPGAAPVAPNDPCPCGSGKKFRKCHGR